MPTLYFVVFNDAEVLDFSGPFDVFSMARVATGLDPFEMKIISVSGKTVTALHGFRVGCDAALGDVVPGPSDIVFVAGGGPPIVNAILGIPPDPATSPPGSAARYTAQHAECQAIVAWLASVGRRAGMVASVCVGAFFSAKAGLFSGREATTHHAFLPDLDALVGAGSGLPPASQATVRHGVRFVMNHSAHPVIAASGGVSCGLDLAFAVLEAVMGRNASEKTRILMEYNGSSNFAMLPLPQMPPELCYADGLSADARAAE